jgi:stage III sporulation protein AA
VFEKYLGLAVSGELNRFSRIQEIRLRVGKKISVIDRTGLHKLKNTVSRESAEKIFSSMCNYSVYALQEEIKNGFITLPEGHRAGICGRCVVSDNKVQNISEISGINIRVAREITGCAEKVYNLLTDNTENTVIISPPNCGKTTLLRDLARLLSDSGINITVVDERGEIFPFYSGESVFDTGENTDVLRFCPKSLGMMMVLRTMNPNVIVTDEIGTEDECEAVSEITKCGVKIITTFHGYGVDDFKNRFSRWNEFYYAVVLNSKKEVDDILCLR